MAKGITVTGTGEVRAAPDIAVVELGAEVLAGTVIEARSGASEAVARLVASLKASGVSAADIRTARISIQPQQEYPPNAAPRLTGYLATNSLSVTLRDLEAIGATIDDAVTAAGDAGRIHGITFAFSNPGALTTEARTRAIADAAANAKTFAKAAGVKVGAVVSISETSPRGGEPRLMMAMAMERGAAKETPIEAGELAVSVSVVVRYAIKR